LRSAVAFAPQSPLSQLARTVSLRSALPF
jgi:hypothetical protein